MKRTGNGLMLAVALTLGLVAQATAKPFKLGQVTSDAIWAVHVDFDAVRDSTVVQKAVEYHKQKHKYAEVHLKMVEALIGMDPCKDLHGLTMYGNKIGKHKGVAILNAKFNRERIQSWADKLPGREKSEYGDITISTWTKKHRDHEYTMATAWFDDSHLVVASGVEELKAALDVLSGKGKAAGEDSPLAGEVAAGTTVLGRFSGINEAELRCNNPVVKQMKSFKFAMGESAGKSFFSAQAVMTNADVVKEVHAVIAGAQALGRLCSTNDELKRRMVDGLKADGDGEKLTINWSGSADDLWTHIQAECKKWHAHRAKWHRHFHKHGGKCPVCSGATVCEKCKASAHADKHKDGKKNHKDDDKKDDEHEKGDDKD